MCITYYTSRIIRMKPKSYNPAGCVTNKPILMRLMPDELQAAEQGAAAAGMSKGSFARKAFLAGFPLVSPDFSTTAVPPSADLSGGEASASPAGFSSIPA